MSYPLQSLEPIVALCRRKGFVYPSSDIYGGLNASYDYGHYGVLLRDEITKLWKQSMVQNHDNITLLDSAIFQHPRVWETSGHVAKFADEIVTCQKCQNRYRVDHIEGELICPEGGACELGTPEEFNLMLKTRLGSMDQDAYMRPETAQGIFINYKNVLQSMRQNPPFGIAQIGKSFRNEITARNFIFRMREFTQMEMEYFVPAHDAQKAYNYWQEVRLDWYLNLGLDPAKLRLREHEADELAHYAVAVSDIEYEFPSGWGELEGIANRGTFDLTNHAKSAKVKFKCEHVNVIEPASGLDRIMLAILADAYREEIVEDRKRTYLALDPKIAPVKAAILPLVNKDGIKEKAQEIYQNIRHIVNVEFDTGGSIGKRYRRQDEIGTPYCICVDYETLEDHTVTVRDRDTLEQKRIPLNELAGLLWPLK